MPLFFFYKKISPDLVQDGSSNRKFKARYVVIMPFAAVLVWQWYEKNQVILNIQQVLVPAIYLEPMEIYFSPSSVEQENAIIAPCFWSKFNK